MAGIRVISFDLDDTLWDVKPTLIRAERACWEWLQEHCPALTQTMTPRDLFAVSQRVLLKQPELAHKISDLRRATLKQALRDCGFSDERSDADSEAAFQVFLERRHEVELFDNVLDVLTRLAMRYPLVAITNGNANVFRTELGPLFQHHIAAEAIGASKPGPEPFLAALEATGVERESMLHIGDHSEHDICGALALGLQVLWFNPEGRQWQHDEWQAPQEFNCFSSLESQLARM